MLSMVSLSPKSNYEDGIYYGSTSLWQKERNGRLSLAGRAAVQDAAPMHHVYDMNG